MLGIGDSRSARFAGPVTTRADHDPLIIDCGLESVHGRIVLALGEVTGHAHAIALDDGPVKARLFDAGTERFLQVLAASILDHEEHAAIALEPGVYRVSKFGTGTQREYTPEAIRNVAD